jgi:predicted DNA-binding antitoxin AbrB/MazE fold protein
MTETQTITAVYENGVLRPERPLKLREHQSVQIQIMPTEPAETPEEQEASLREMNRILQSLVDAGILTLPAGHSSVEPMSERERQELAEEMGRTPGRPLSEIIIEDRGEW